MGQGNDLEREFSAVYDEFSASLLRYARALTGSAGPAEDAVQEAFLRYFEFRTKGGHVENEEAWLTRVARNALFDSWNESVDLRCLGNPLSAQADPRPDIEKRLAQAQFERRLPGLLSPRELECVRLRAAGLSYNEVAARLQIRTGTVGALLTRATTKLKQAGPGHGRARCQ